MQANTAQLLFTAKEHLLTPAAINEITLEKILQTLSKRPIDDADLYFQSIYDESWYLEDSAVKSGDFSMEHGVGIRVVSGEKTGYAYCDTIQLDNLERAADAARSIAYGSTSQTHPILSTTQPKLYYSAQNPIDGWTKYEKIALLQSIDQTARAIDSRVIQVNASLSSSYEIILIASLDGQLKADIRPLVSINVSVIVEDKHNKRESARSGGGGRGDYSFFFHQEKALQYAHEAVAEALLNLDAVAAPAGTMPVILGPGWPGVLLHEAVGHGLEADFNRKGLSAFSGRIGQQIAAKGVTVVDNGTLPNRRGSLSMDDEGTPSQCTTLIEDGILVNYMQDKLNARLMNMQPTGNCRRESYAHAPIPRMTNTYMLAGKYTPQEIIASVKKGIYAVNFGGGQVDITSGQFVFSASKAFLIEDGQIKHPIKGVTLIGNGPEIMQKISMVGNDLELDSGIGVCGKAGQSVPVGVGQPTLKIDQLTVGGTTAHN